MAQTILSREQERFLEAVSGQMLFRKRFYLTGGTALAACYLRHRYSEDLDFYLILQMTKWDFSDLLKKARIKFDVYIDPIQLGSQLMRVEDLRDYPRMLAKIKDVEWQTFFMKEAGKLKPRVLR